MTMVDFFYHANFVTSLGRIIVFCKKYRISCDSHFKLTLGAKPPKHLRRKLESHEESLSATSKSFVLSNHMHKELMSMQRGLPVTHDNKIHLI